MDNHKTLDDLLSALTEGLPDEELLMAAIQSDIAAAISTARTAKGLSQQQLADSLGVSQALVSRWENGDANFTLETLVRIALKLDIEMKSPYIVVRSQAYLTNTPKAEPIRSYLNYMASSIKPKKHGWMVGSGSQLKKV